MQKYSAKVLIEYTNFLGNDYAIICITHSNIPVYLVIFNYDSIGRFSNFEKAVKYLQKSAM